MGVLLSRKISLLWTSEENLQLILLGLGLGKNRLKSDQTYRFCYAEQWAEIQKKYAYYQLFLWRNLKERERETWIYHIFLFFPPIPYRPLLFVLFLISWSGISSSHFFSDHADLSLFFSLPHPKYASLQNSQFTRSGRFVLNVNQ